MRTRRRILAIVAALAACGPYDDFDEPQVPPDCVFDAGQIQYRWPQPIEDQARFRPLFFDGGVGAQR